VAALLEDHFGGVTSAERLINADLIPCHLQHVDFREAALRTRRLWPQSFLDTHAVLSLMFAERLATVDPAVLPLDLLVFWLLVTGEAVHVTFPDHYFLLPLPNIVYLSLDGVKVG